MSIGSRAMFRSLLSRQGSLKISPSFRLDTNEAAQLLKGLVAVNGSQIRKADARMGGSLRGHFPIIEGIHAGTIRYRRYDPQEHWKTWREMLDEQRAGGVGTGDCEDLSSAVVAELRFNGIPARTYVYQSGPRLYHVVVKTKRWGLLDPSRAAGMEGNG